MVTYNEKGHRPGFLFPAGGLSDLAVAHSGGAGYDDPDDNANEYEENSAGPKGYDYSRAVQSGCHYVFENSLQVR
jgi:hypothetical protein